MQVTMNRSLGQSVKPNKQKERDESSVFFKPSTTISSSTTIRPPTLKQVQPTPKHTLLDASPSDIRCSSAPKWCWFGSYKVVIRCILGVGGGLGSVGKVIGIKVLFYLRSRFRAPPKTDWYKKLVLKRRCILGVAFKGFQYSSLKRNLAHPMQGCLKSCLQVSRPRQSMSINRPPKATVCPPKYSFPPPMDQYSPSKDAASLDMSHMTPFYPEPMSPDNPFKSAPPLPEVFAAIEPSTTVDPPPATDSPQDLSRGDDNKDKGKEKVVDPQPKPDQNLSMLEAQAKELRYREVSELLKSGNVHIPGIVNPSQLARFLNIEPKKK